MITTAGIAPSWNGGAASANRSQGRDEPPIMSSRESSGAPPADRPRRSPRGASANTRDIVPPEPPQGSWVPQIEPLLAGLMHELQADAVTVMIVEDSQQPLPFRRVLRVDLLPDEAAKCHIHEQTDREVAALLECTTPRISNIEDASSVASALHVPLGGNAAAVGLIEVRRLPPRAAYRRADLDALIALVPGYSLALQTLLRCRWSQLYASTLDTMAHGLALIDVRRQLYGCNTTMQRALERGDGLRLLDRQVIACNAQVDQALVNAVRRVTGERRAMRALVEIERPGFPLPYFVLLRGDSRRGSFGGADSPLLQLTLADPASLHHEAMFEIGGAFGLTAAERDVALSMVQGHDVDETSARMQISENTVRWHQKRIFSKTGSRGRTELALRFMHALNLFGIN